jgi:hypothetical protein
VTGGQADELLLLGRLGHRLAERDATVRGVDAAGRRLEGSIGGLAGEESTGGAGFAGLADGERPEQALPVAPGRRVPSSRPLTLSHAPSALRPP